MPRLFSSVHFNFSFHLLDIAGALLDRFVEVQLLESVFFACPPRASTAFSGCRPFWIFQCMLKTEFILTSETFPRFVITGLKNSIIISIAAINYCWASLGNFCFKCSFFCFSFITQLFFRYNTQYTFYKQKHTKNASFIKHKKLYRAFCRQATRLTLNTPVFRGLLRVNRKAEKKM